jgi:hypothetical protein
VDNGIVVARSSTGEGKINTIFGCGKLPALLGFPRHLRYVVQPPVSSVGSNFFSTGKIVAPGSRVQGDPPSHSLRTYSTNRYPSPISGPVIGMVLGALATAEKIDM